MNRRGGTTFLSRILFAIVLITIMRSIFFGSSWGGFVSMTPIVMMFVFFTFVSLVSSKAKQSERRDQRRKDLNDVSAFSEKKEEKKSEYDFDDEFAIDPRDYE